MAKIKPKLRARGTGRGTIIKSKVFVGRTWSHPGGGEFEACVIIGSAFGARKAGPSAPVCAIGKNPRVAVGLALTKAGAAIKKRTGAFAGFKRRKRRR